jgi:hypothetical protein
MIAGTDAFSANVHDGHAPNAAKGPRCLCRSLTGICIGGTILTAAGCILGSYDLVGPEVTASLLLSHLGFAIGWLLIVLLFARRMVSTGRWRVLLLGTAICWGGPTLVGYVFVWGPTQKIRSSDWNPTSDAEVRSVCHRSLVWRTEPHDEVIFLGNCGDESSVPYLIWWLRWVVPSDEKQRDCTWSHALYALRTITNNSVDSTRGEWTQWYAAHKHQTRLEWWATGFTAEGYPVSATGGEESIQNLLKVLGRTPWCQPDCTEWLSRNAIRMLALMDEKDVRRVINQVLRSGSVQERCGVARYVYKLDRANSEAILRELLRDDQRPVRLCASGMLSRLQLEWCKNPPGFIERRLEAGALTDDEFFSPSGASVVTAKVGTQTNASQWSRERRSTIEAVSAASSVQPDRPACVIRIDWPSDQAKSSEWLAAIGIDGISSTSGQTVYSRELVATDPLNASELRWLYDPVGDSVYVSIPNYTGKIAPKTGEVIWEMGFGTGNINYISLIKDYLIIDVQGHLVVCDAAHGGILANYDLPRQLFRDRISLVNGQLRAKDFDGALYMLTLPATAISDGGTSPAAQKEQ